MALARFQDSVTETRTDSTNRDAFRRKGNLDFDNPGCVGKAHSEYHPADIMGSINQSPANLEQLTPGMADQFDRQDGQVSRGKN
ncbi:hypothetical protein [Comamonas thiooxydans]|uniref:hypothetical protein n=1 Tax=Comamonas thiooxydans TaxID=363952 RepID=UPI00059F6EFE